MRHELQQYLTGIMNEQQRNPALIQPLSRTSKSHHQLGGVKPGRQLPIFASRMPVSTNLLRILENTQSD